jgi:hypothetical protein
MLNGNSSPSAKAGLVTEKTPASPVELSAPSPVDDEPIVASVVESSVVELPDVGSPELALPVVGASVVGASEVDPVASPVVEDEVVPVSAGSESSPHATAEQAKSAMRQQRRIGAA